MAGFLEGYETAGVRREKIVRRLVIAGVLVIVAVLVGYFVFRTWPAKRRVNVFLEDLQKRDYQAAYRMFGCEKPCRDYAFDKFMEDWGPKSAFANPAEARIKNSHFCNTGVIVTVTPGRGEDVPLWYQRSDRSLGFSPWPFCVEHIPAPSQVPPPKGLPGQ